MAFAAEIEAADWPEVREVAPALTSVAVFFDALAIAPEEMRERLLNCLALRDWTAMSAPVGKLWRVPVSFDEEHAVHISEVADLVGVSPSQAIAELCAESLRVLALGFAPGQPYLGRLPVQWNIPRQTGLTRAVAEGAVVVAVRQAIIFATSAPTGWRQVGWTGFRPFEKRDGGALHFVPGDRVHFVQRPADEVQAGASEPLGGAEVIS